MSFARYVWHELVRNPRRTIASLVGVVVGVGLFSGVLFFVDGSGASMTRRAVAPLTLDVQRVLTAPLGGGVRLDRRLADAAVDAGGTTTVTLTVSNGGLAASHEVVVRDRPVAPLAYVPSSTTFDGAPILDPGGEIPTAQGSAGAGLNIGTVEAHAVHTIAYRVSAERRAPRTPDLPVQATISTRETPAPARANAPRPTPLPQLAAQVRRVPGVAAADPLVSVDMAPGAISRGASNVPGPVKLFAFDARYRAHHPSIKMVSGDIRPGAAIISAEAARALGVRAGDHVTLALPGGAAPVDLEVSGITDLSTARPLFESRVGSTLEHFEYVPYTIVVGDDVYRGQVAPAFEAAAARLGPAIRSFPLEELDILVERSRLNSDPATALAQTQSISGAVRRVAPEQDYLIDNISNTLEVAKGDARIAKRMFVFLGLPGAVLAAILTAYAGTILAEAQRRENALLRVRGANRRHLLSLLALRTVAIAGIGSLLGTALGFASVLVLLGSSLLFEASTGALLQSASIGVAVGVLVTAVALYIPGRRLVSREIKQELAVVSRGATPGWGRLLIGVVAIAGAAAAQLIALRRGAFDLPAGSVYEGRSVSLPIQLLIPPIVVWLAGIVLISGAVHEMAARAASTREPPRFGRLLPGVLWRSLTRRLSALTLGMIAVGLVVGLGTTLACFGTAYDDAKRADSRFLVGSDVRLTPNPTSGERHPVDLATALRVDGARAATAVVSSPKNAVLTSDFNEDVATLTAVDPDAFAEIASLRDSIFVDATAAQAIAKLHANPDGVFVNTALADGLKLGTGDTARVLLGRGTAQQARRPVKILGLFSRFPGAPQATDIVANLGFYERVTGLTDADYYLVSTADHSRSGVARVARALSAREGFARRFQIETSATALDKEQSSLTGLHVRGLLDLNSFYTFLMAATATAMFVFGLLLQRRREYVTFRAQGFQRGQIRGLVLAESAICATLGALVGLLVGVGLSSQFIQVLRPIFTLSPPRRVPGVALATLAALVLAATAVSSVAAAVLIARLRPTELLREE